MFSFLNKKKKIDPNQVKAFDSAVRAIEVFIALSDWPNAKRAIDEILYKEKEALNRFLEKFEWEWSNLADRKLAEKERKSYKNKEKTILKLKDKIHDLEEKYIKVAEIERFKVRFSKIKSEIDLLIWTKRPLQAMNLLQKFLEENKENSIVIKFYNREKKRVQVSIEKQRKEEQEKLRRNAKNEALQLIWETARLDKDEDS